MRLAPVALFTYKRARHAASALESILANPESRASRIVVFSDGPKSEEDCALVEETRSAIGKYRTPNLECVARERNAGLAASIIDGVTGLCQEHGRVIVVEDDLIVAPSFLRYMNQALDRYAAETRVVQVSGFVYPVGTVTEGRCSLLPFTSSWGWATWSRAWKLFEPAGGAFERLASDASLRRRFDLGGAYPYFNMLKAQQAGRVDSWAIRWYASTFLHGGLTLYPGRSLVYNAGFDGSGTHRGAMGQASVTDVVRRDEEFVFPDVEVDEALLHAVRRFVARERSLVARIWARLRPALPGALRGGS